MKKLFFCYRYMTDNRGNLYTPANTLQNAYPELEELATIVVEKVKKSGLSNNLGWIECDESVYDQLKSEISSMGLAAMMQVMTGNEAIAYMDNKACCECTSEDETCKTYCICAADEEMGVEAEYLTIEKGDT